MIIFATALYKYINSLKQQNFLSREIEGCNVQRWSWAPAELRQLVQIIYDN